jgi:hypothetical protein
VNENSALPFGRGRDDGIGKGKRKSGRAKANFGEVDGRVENRTENSLWFMRKFITV